MKDLAGADLVGAVRTGAAGAEAAVPLPLRPEMSWVRLKYLIFHQKAYQ